MLKIALESRECFNEETNEFIVVPGRIIELEHSLVSLSKWESIWKRPFLSKPPATMDEICSYIECMNLTDSEIPKDILYSMSQETIKEIVSYMEDTKTATWFSNKRGRKRRISNSVVTAEVIYWQMIELGVPFECQYWHLNKLLTLIRVCDEKGQPPKKMSNNEILKEYANVNSARRKMRK